MERVTGIGPVSSVWKTDIITIIRYPRVVNGTLHAKLEASGCGVEFTGGGSVWQEEEELNINRKGPDFDVQAF